MGGTASVSRNRYEYSESTDIAPEDIARALREVQEQQNMNKNGWVQNFLKKLKDHEFILLLFSKFFASYKT